MKTKSFVTKILLSFICVATLAFGVAFLTPITAQAEITGDGTEESPYIVSTIDELNEALKKTDNAVNYINFSEGVGDLTGKIGSWTTIKPFVLDLNGRTLYSSSESSSSVISIGVKATIKNGTIKGESGAVNVGVTASPLEVKLENLIVSAKQTGVSMWNSNGRLSIINCQIESISGGYSALSVSNDATVTLSQGIRLQGKPFAIEINDADALVALDGYTYTQAEPYIGASYLSPHVCGDGNGDCVCDVLGEEFHLDNNRDCVCDKEKCQKTVHTDVNNDCVCDYCPSILHEYIDARCVYCREYSFQGEGTEESPYIVKTAEELATAANMTEIRKIILWLSTILPLMPI